MGVTEQTAALDKVLVRIDGSELKGTAQVQRIRTEIGFAQQFAELHEEKQSKWLDLVLQAAELVADRLLSSGSLDLTAMVNDAEAVMSPIGKVAKEYTVHCCGHAHIDMNWLWPWQETISVTHDTFSTVDRLMQEFPDFRFSQSQASMYAMMEERCPEIFGMIKTRMAGGKWEPMASMWVEGDKNLASGEILCRHMLYSKRYMKERFDLPYDATKIDWECDTFGHAHTLPSILVRGGVTRYYRHRVGPWLWLMWWQAPDGSKVLTFFDKGTYVGPIEPNRIARWFIDYVNETGLKDFLWVYGVGDHGGGPTRRDLFAARDINEWPIFPRLRLSTTTEYFDAIEPYAESLPVYNDELNCVFEGCYTSQSYIKLANRVSENILPEIETISVVAGAVAGFPYPGDDIQKAWKHAMFNQFHDILPGSGIPVTYDYSQGLFQEIQGIAAAVRARALRQLASKVDTSWVSDETSIGIGEGFGAGAGDSMLAGGVSAYSAGAALAEPFLIFNPLPFARREMVSAKIWNKELPADRLLARDESGRESPAQVVATGHHYGHEYVEVMFPVEVPGAGYRVYTVDRTANHIDVKGSNLSFAPIAYPGDRAKLADPPVMENEYLKIELDSASGAIKHLVDKATGYDYVPNGKLIGLLELHQEAPGDMSAWEIGQIEKVTPFLDGAHLETVYKAQYRHDLVRNGPNRCAVRSVRTLNESKICLEIGLNSGSRTIDFTLRIDWLERGTPETGCPMLKIAFPLSIEDPKAIYEIPFGSIERPVNGHEVPALKWADSSGTKLRADGTCGMTLLNSSKYGHSADGNTLRLTLLRSSYSPDPLPEMGHHEIKLAIIPHEGRCSVSEATKAGATFNLPMNVVSTDVHHGLLQPHKGHVEVLSPNVMVTGLKKAEDSNSLVIRLFEMEGLDTEARVKLTDLVPSGAPAQEVDLIEQPLPVSSANMQEDTLVLHIPAHGIATVAIACE